MLFKFLADNESDLMKQQKTRVNVMIMMNPLKKKRQKRHETMSQLKRLKVY